MDQKILKNIIRIKNKNIYDYHIDNQNNYIYIFILFRRLYNKSQAYDFFKIKNLVIFKIYSSLVIEIYNVKYM